MVLTGHFLVHHVFAPQRRSLPAARTRLAERMQRAAAASGNATLARIAGEGGPSP
jgi:hypothetical protein